MTAFDAARESWEAAAPRPWLMVVRDAIGLLLCGICAVSVSFLMWCLL